jgi:E3 ubiquitin-protein ligase BAH
MDALYTSRLFFMERLKLMFGSTANLDPALKNFLMRYFPDEVKAKQRLNDRMTAIDQFGEAYVDARCAIM